MHQLLNADLNNFVKDNHNEIHHWIKNNYKNKAFFYSSIDIRYSGSKIAPVDTNIFPAGFNNLSKISLENAAKLAEEYLNSNFNHPKKIILIPESHTRNLGYLANVKAIFEILVNSGLEVVIGTLDNQLKDFKINEQDELKYHLLKIENNSLITENGFKADCIIVNNDMTAGSPKVLQNITQPILPPVGMGWYQRQKKHNLDCYKKIIGEFAKEFQINENLISTEYSFCKNINFKERKGLDCIANQVEKVLFKIKENYKQLNIKDKPYVFLKANRGTYGMGIMTAQSGDEIYEINKKNRNKMAVIRDNTQNAEIIIQEGVKTEKTYQNHPCEAFIYQIAGKTAGMIYRINKNKDQFSNLNSHGVEFKAIDKENIKDEYFLYDLIASLSSLAASYE